MKKRTVALFLTVIILEAIFFLTKDMLFSGYKKKAIAENIKKLYELSNPGTRVEVESINEQNGMYKVILRLIGASGTNYAEAFVTKDGGLLTTSMIRVDKFIDQMQKLKDFVDCLDSKGVRIYGVLNRTASPAGASATLLQLQTFGVYSSKLYVSCDGPFIQRCVRLNITKVPTIVIENKKYEGVKTISWLEQMTGCKL